MRPFIWSSDSKQCHNIEDLVSSDFISLNEVETWDTEALKDYFRHVVLSAPEQERKSVQDRICYTTKSQNCIRDQEI